MEYKSLTIGIKNCTLEEITKVLESVIASEKLVEVRKMFGINISVSDYTEEFEYTSKFLKENNLDDENPFFNVFDINPYGLQIDFEVLQNFKYLDIIEPMVFVLGKHFSSILKAECIVMFENMQLPVGLFKDGILTETFENYNSAFFENRSWTPKSI